MEKAHSLLIAKLQVYYTILSSVCQPKFNDFFYRSHWKNAYFGTQKETDRVHFDGHSLFFRFIKSRTQAHAALQRDGFAVHELEIG